MATELGTCYAGCMEYYVDCTAQSLVLTVSYLAPCLVLHFFVLYKCILQLMKWKAKTIQVRFVLILLFLLQCATISEQGHMWLWAAQFVHVHPWDTVNIIIASFHHTFFSSYVSMQASNLAEILSGADKLNMNQGQLKGLNFASVFLGCADLLATVIILVSTPNEDEFWNWMAPTALYIIYANTLVIAALLFVCYRINIPFAHYKKKLQEILVAHAFSCWMSFLEQANVTWWWVIPMWVWGLQNFTSVIIYWFQFRTTGTGNTKASKSGTTRGATGATRSKGPSSRRASGDADPAAAMPGGIMQAVQKAAPTLSAPAGNSTQI